jgi:tetratricopeptide (TPR) repeat protein
MVETPAQVRGRPGQHPALSWRMVALAAALAVTTATPVTAVGPSDTPLKEEALYKAGVAAIDARDWELALRIFHRMQPEHAAAPEVANWLGFAYRKLKRYPESKRWYDQALLLDPNYLPALEYQGEWFIETNDLPSAKANLAKLERLCGRCHEWQDLDASIRKAEGR